MKQDVKCPYCEQWNEIDHEDGFGYEEDIIHVMECRKCDKIFAFTTSISFYYKARKADCLNGKDHIYELTHTIPKEFSMMRCGDCGEERELTESERVKYDIMTKDEYFESL